MDEPFDGNDVFNREDFYRVLLGILEPTETILLSTHLLEEVQLHQPGGAPPVGTDRRGRDRRAEERGQSLMDYVRSACGYEPGRVLRRWSGWTAGRNSHAEISAALCPPGRSVRRTAGGGLRRRAGPPGGGVLPGGNPAGDPAAADGVELTWVSTCGYHLFWHSTFPAAAPEEAETRFSYSGQRQSWIIELDEDVLELSPGLNFLDIAPDSPSAGLRALWAELSAQTSPLPGDETYTEHNGLISIKREIQLADYLTDFPLSVDRLAYTAWAADREFGTSQYDTSINTEELTRRFRAYFPIPMPEGLAMEISMTPDASGQLLSACFLTLDSSLLTLQADCVSTGEGVLFALCAGGSMAKALDGSGIPGGWGIYRLSSGGDLETVYSIPNGGRAMAFWSDGDGTLFLLTEEKGAVLLTLLDVDTLTPVAAWELFPAAEGAPHPQVFPQSDGSFCLLSAGDFLAVLNRRSGAWVVDFTADTSLQSSLGCPLSTPSSRLSLCYDGTRLAITGPCPSTKSEYFLAVYTADGLEYLGGYTSSLYGNHPPDCYPWGSWQDGSCRSIALEPSLPGTETAS